MWQQTALPVMYGVFAAHASTGMSDFSSIPVRLHEASLIYQCQLTWGHDPGKPESSGEQQ
jgi:hypothetical protein